MNAISFPGAAMASTSVHVSRGLQPVEIAAVRIATNVPLQATTRPISILKQFVAQPVCEERLGNSEG